MPESRADWPASDVPESMPMLALMSGARDGWLGGRTILADKAVSAVRTSGLSHASRALEARFRSASRGLTAALLTYDGDTYVAEFDAYAELAPLATPVLSTDGWAPLLTEVRRDMSRDTFVARVESARAKIATGDVYVLNLTARISGQVALSPWETCVALNERTHASMSAFFGDASGRGPTIASASPERFFTLKRGPLETTVSVWPVKGTRPRGADVTADGRTIAELTNNEKERAEHVMIVDLIRNDIGRFATPGTVRVRPLIEVVSTPYCHQLVSGVSGVLRPSATLLDVLESLFPCGSVTGAPKRAAMRIIDELETSPRQAYCGALVVAVSGEIDSSVLIRTLEWTSPRTATWGAGCGITYDSVASAEWDELLLKSTPVLGR